MDLETRKNINLVCILSVIVLTLCACGKEEKAIEFTTEKWQTIAVDDRYLMLDDLQNKYDLIGMTYEEIITLLGEQSVTYDPDNNRDNGNYYLGYDIRYDSFEGEEVLLIKFKDNKVIAVEKEYLSNL